MTATPVERPRRLRLLAYIGIDELYALGAVAITLGGVIGGKAVLFSLCGLLALVFDHRLVLVQMRRLADVRFVPLLLFLAVHLLSGLTVSGENFFYLATQVGVVAAWVAPFFLRYTTHPMARFNRAFGWLVIAIVVGLVGWHIAQGRYTGFKHLGETKTALSLLPVVLLAYGTAQKRLTPALAAFLAATAIVILFSGERKAYFCLAIALVLMAPLRNPLVFVLPLGGLALMPALARLDPSGYVQRQIDSVLAFTQGEVADTLSNRMREWQAEYVLYLFNENRFAGIGTRNYVQTMLGSYQGSKSDVIVPGLGIHGDFWRVLAENGVLGMTAWSMFLAASVFFVLPARRRGVPRSLRERKISFLILASILIFVAFEAYDTTMMIAYGVLPFLGLLQIDVPKAQAVRPLHVRRAPLLLNR